MYQLLVLVVGFALGLLAVAVRGYAVEKGKNLATKEDVAEITSKVERVRSESQAHLERLRAELSESELINRTQYELELAAYREVWESLLPVHRAAASLRPALDFGLGPGETDESRRQGRLKMFSDSFNPFSAVVWKHRPFYPEAVFTDLNELLRLMRSEAIEYQVFSADRQPDDWEKAMASVKRIDDQVEKVCDTIRVRLSAARVA